MFRVIFIILFLSACGFQPIYKTDISGNETRYESKLAAVEFSGKRKRIYQKLEENLKKVLNPNKINVKKEYILNIETSKRISTAFINPTGSSGRNMVTLRANYTLTRISDDEVIATGDTLAKDHYDIEDRRFANYIAEENIELNLTNLIAQNIRDSLINDLFFPKEDLGESSAD